MIRTLEKQLFKNFSLNAIESWVEVLQEIVKTYINQGYSKIAMRTRDVNRSIEAETLKISYINLKIARPRKYNIGYVVTKHFFLIPLYIYW